MVFNFIKFSGLFALLDAIGIDFLGSGPR